MTATRTDADQVAITSAVLAAAEAAAELLPSKGPLTPGNPTTDGEQVAFAQDGAAASARLTGEVSGDIVVVVGKDVVTALASSSIGSLDAVVRPALEAAAAALGRVSVTSAQSVEPVAAMDGLKDKGVFVAVPLLDGGTQVATFALQVDLPAPKPSRSSLDLLRNVSMEVTVEIGRTRMTVQELLGLRPGEVLGLDRAAGGPADLLVNGTLLARGEVVVVDEDFALRITEIVQSVDGLTR